MKVCECQHVKIAVIAAVISRRLSFAHSLRFLSNDTCPASHTPQPGFLILSKALGILLFCFVFSLRRELLDYYCHFFCDWTSVTAA